MLADGNRSGDRERQLTALITVDGSRIVGVNPPKVVQTDKGSELGRPPARCWLPTLAIALNDSTTKAADPADPRA